MTETRTPDRVRETIAEIMSDPSMSGGIDLMMERADELGSPLKAKLIGIANTPAARRYWDNSLDEWWKENTVPKEHDEIVIGSGIHAAIYCAARVAMGAPKPLVIEQESRPGGSFAYTKEPSFYVNSRNRPGELGIPGREEALNFIPGAVVQPADLSSDEYQSNVEIAFCIRVMLAMYARVCSCKSHLSIFVDGGVILADNTVVKGKRVIFATGLGKPMMSTIVGANEKEENNGRLMDYPTFLRRFDEPFPLKGMKRVAVIGSGDAGKTVVEALLGQSPAEAMSVASLDFPERIDWYGVRPEACTRQGWENCNRSRYLGIARALPRGASPGEFPDDARIFPSSRRAEAIEMASNGVYVDGAFYDAVIVAVGFRNIEVRGNVITLGGRNVARRTTYDFAYYIGPAAGIPAEERGNLNAEGIPENTVSIFRYADRTVMLARSFPVENAVNVRFESLVTDRIFNDVAEAVQEEKANRFRKLKKRVEASEKGQSKKDNPKKASQRKSSPRKTKRKRPVYRV